MMDETSLSLANIEDKLNRNGVEGTRTCKTADIDKRAATIKPIKYFSIFEKMQKNSPKRLEKEPEQPEVSLIQNL